jgi:hypothetical protein
MYSLDSHKELLDAVLRMAYIAEFREGDNTGHLERIKGYTQLLGRGFHRKRGAAHHLLRYDI